MWHTYYNSSIHDQAGIKSSVNLGCSTVSREWPDGHFPPDTVMNFWSQYLPDPDTNISTCMHFIYCAMYIGFCHCSEWIGIP